MRRIARQMGAVSLLSLLAGACASTAQISEYSEPGAGFSTVAETTRKATGRSSVWIQNQEHAESLKKQVHGLVHKKTVSADTAIQVALLNNRGLQAAYADLGMSAADVWQQLLPENPRVSIGTFGIGAPGLDAFRSIEGTVAANILSLATRKDRVDLADTRFRQAQLRAAEETLRLAGATRKAWIDAVSGFEAVQVLNQAQVAADAASELAEKLGETGALPKAGQAREHVFYAELTGQKAEARLAARLAKEELARLMGLWGDEVDFFVPDQLPALPGRLAVKDAVEAEALKNRVDLQIARLELEAMSKSYRFTEATRYVTDLELIGGLEVERERDDGETSTSTTPQFELEFVIPVFDSGKARLRKAELAYMRAANLLAERAVNIRSEARSAYTAYRSTHDIARHYQTNVLPLRTRIEEEGLLTNNAMFTNTFELLADTRAKTNAMLLAGRAKRDFWLADADLSGAIFGGRGAAGGGDSEAIAVADSSGGGH
ncbi:TolC family protein [Stappia sp. F7233]|uniref:TolC family protein n=1 Tax=Stappia albiluteola TaxID=2758565 RepID=A0A839A7M6_9HYPH|nr:TolC family protein [Stappia albiluteola]